MSTKRIKPEAGFVVPSQLEKGPNGRNLCRRCRDEVPVGRRTFCSEECIHEWKIRSQPGYAREEVWKRDGGICALCHLNTQAIQAEMIALRRKLVAEVMKSDHYHVIAGSLQSKIEDRPEWVEFCQRYGFKVSHDPTRAPWHADHITPVVEGGGECGLENLRTLCLACHNAETKALRKRLAEANRLKKTNGNLPPVT